MQVIEKYFPGLNRDQYLALERLYPLYRFWNSRINLISRGDIGHFYLRHVLHSLSVARLRLIENDQCVLDAGTGGGFPGLPLAILFPGTRFTLLDSIRKKITVIDAIISETGISNVKTVCSRIENHGDQYQLILGRAVAKLPAFVQLTRKNLATDASGILYLTGGDLKRETAGLAGRFTVYGISDLFGEDFFSTKKIVFLPAGEINQGIFLSYTKKT